MTAPDGPENSAPVVLGDRYEIHRRIARGGMAEVFLARDARLDRPVAVKILFPEYATDPSFVERFRREAQAAAGLTDPSIVGVYDWGTEGGTYYIVMEYVDGPSVAEELRSTGPMDARRVAELGFAVAGALGTAHHKGVIHRDVKPGNVLLATNGVPKVADFGIARALTSPAEELTQAGNVMGTATYFSPEQAQGFAVDPRSDLYSLGVVMFEMLCGRPPFSGDTPVSIAYQHVQEAPPRPSDLVAGVPDGLEAILGKLLVKNPEGRYKTADDLRADLRRFLDGQQTVAEQELLASRGPGAAAAVAAGAGAGAVAGAAMAGDPTIAQPAVSADPAATTMQPTVGPPPDGNATGEGDDGDGGGTAKFAAIVVVLLLLLGGLGWWLWSSLNDDDAETATVPDVTDMTEEDARDAIEDAGFNFQSQDVPNGNVVVGVVFAQTPTGGSELELGEDVLVSVSSGNEAVTLGDFEGMTREQAESLLRGAGFDVDIEEVESDQPSGTVVGTTPPAGEEVVPGEDVITLLVSAGSGEVQIPDVAGLSPDEARQRLEDAGFSVRATEGRPSSDVPAGDVIGTDPSGVAAEGSSLLLLVSTGPEKVIVPEVTGQTEAAATAAIEDRGLQVAVNPVPLTVGDPNDGRVMDVDPSPGTELDPGDTVTIDVGVATVEPTTTTSPDPTTTTSP